MKAKSKIILKSLADLPAVLMSSLTARSLSPLQLPQPWPRGGLNE